VAVTAALAGCGDDSTMTAAGNDLAAVADLAVPVDLAALSCDSILACRHACGANLVCQQACANSGTTAAKTLYQALVGCLADSCSGVDGGTHACASPTDSSAGCLSCLASSFDAASGSAAACHTEFLACTGG
jgi:hypothetical protein